MFNEREVTVSISTIRRELIGFNYSLKRVEIIPQARNTELNINIRYEYANFYLSLNENIVVFLDEFGISCSSRVDNGRSEIG
jgi:hypothetical protein